VQTGDFETVWNTFSSRKLREMSRAGITRDGFIRLQKLTRKVESDMSINVGKTKEEGENTYLALLRQTQSGRPDVFIKQQWVLEDQVWKLDDEEKKTLSNETPSAPNASNTDAPAAVPSATPKPPVTSLPGISN
jgi:hypothetical protein